MEMISVGSISTIIPTKICIKYFFSCKICIKVKYLHKVTNICVTKASTVKRRMTSEEVLEHMAKDKYVYFDKHS